MKKFLLVCLSVMMMLCFAGCKKDADNAQAVKPDEKTVEQEAPKDNAEAPRAADDAANAEQAAAPEVAAPAEAAAPEAAANDAPVAPIAVGEGCSVNLDENNLTAESMLKVLEDFYIGLNTSADNASGDCDKFGTGAMSVLEACKNNLTTVFKNVEKVPVDETSPQAIRISKLADEGQFKKQMESCEQNDKVMMFAIGMMGVMMAAAPEGALNGAAAPDDAPDEAAAPEAPAEAKDAK